ncbi:hypothetical protein SNE40_018858 [Patella caerulea]|uniref:DUF3504 domain-containing protein n=1 Tax=Patella caerulea TaxID=87958 RepID=A0AAN8P4Q3_PATCE
MDLRKPKASKQDKEKSLVMPGTVTDSNIMYNMVVVATDHLLQYATTKGHYTISTVSQMTKAQLAEFLKDFYSTFKNSPDDIITTIREGLHQFFLNENGFDIINDIAFDYANLIYQRCAKRKGLLMSRESMLGQSSPRASPGPRSSPVPSSYSFTGIKPVKQSRIQYESLKKLYLSDALAGNYPESLQNKVYFDVNLYIINRGKDCLRTMVKSDFDIGTDETGRRYVWLKYSDKFSIREVGNVPGDDRTVNGNQLGDRMYERPGDPRCPLASFLRYVTHLHPMTDAFWQRPKRQVNESDYVWFDNTALGNSSLSKFMQKICLQAGLMDSYTNNAIRGVYIPAVESICRENSGVTQPQSVMQVIPEPTIKVEKLEESPSLEPLQVESGVQDDASSSDSEIKSEFDDRDVNRLDDQSLGLRDSKMEVLNLLQRLMVKDIQKFVDWLKTVRVEKSGGELTVLCSPVDKATIDPEIANPTTNGDNKGNNSTGNGVATQNGEKSVDGSKNVHEASMENEHMDSLEGISIKQVDFLTLDSTHCSCKELRPIKVTIPTSDTLLVTGITEDTQLLLHRKCGQTVGSENLKDRVFHSENDMDVAEVAAMLSTRTRISSPVITPHSHSNSDFQSSLPPRKRMTDSLFQMNSPAKRLCNIRNIDEESESDINLETNLNCLKPATLKSLPLKHKKKVRFSSGIQAFKIKTESIHSLTN